MILRRQMQEAVASIVRLGQVGASIDQYLEALVRLRRAHASEHDGCHSAPLLRDVGLADGNFVCLELKLAPRHFAE